MFSMRSQVFSCALVVVVYNIGCYVTSSRK